MTCPPDYYLDESYLSFMGIAPKQRLWVLVGTASARRFLRVPTIYVLSKNKFFFSTENFHFLQLLKSLYIAWACSRNEN